MHNYLQILEEVLQNYFIPGLTGELAISDIFQHIYSYRLEWWYDCDNA